MFNALSAEGHTKKVAIFVAPRLAQNLATWFCVLADPSLEAREDAARSQKLCGQDTFGLSLDVTKDVLRIAVSACGHHKMRNGADLRKADVWGKGIGKMRDRKREVAKGSKGEVDSFSNSGGRGGGKGGEQG